MGKKKTKTKVFSPSCQNYIGVLFECVPFVLSKQIYILYCRYDCEHFSWTRNRCNFIYYVIIWTLTILVHNGNGKQKVTIVIVIAYEDRKWKSHNTIVRYEKKKNEMKWKLTNEKLAENNKVVAMASHFFCSNPFACDNIFI